MHRVSAVEASAPTGADSLVLMHAEVANVAAKQETTALIGIDYLVRYRCATRVVGALFEAALLGLDPRKTPPAG